MRCSRTPAMVNPRREQQLSAVHGFHRRLRMLTRKTWHRTALITLTAITMSAGLASATHVRIEGSVEQPLSPGLTVVAPPSLQADEIKAHEVRAQVIYANKIEADEVRGTIHQAKGIKISDA